VVGRICHDLRPSVWLWNTVFAEWAIRSRLTLEGGSTLEPLVQLTRDGVVVLADSLLDRQQLRESRRHGFPSFLF
jgi:hypothetical protein